jgi:pilus assembly protein CpaC
MNAFSMRRALAGFLVVLAGLGAAAAPANAWTEVSAPATQKRLALEQGQSRVIEVAKPFATLAVADPERAQVVATSNRSFFVRGKAPGSTTLIICDAAGEMIDLIEIDVTVSLQALRADLDRILPGEDITAYPVFDGVMLDGNVTTIAAADMALKIAERHVPGGVANALEIRQSQQVMLEVRFIEASRDVVKELGVGTATSVNGGFDIITGGGELGGGLVSGLAAQALASGGLDLGSSRLDLTLRALEEEGVVRTLAEPNLVAMSGDTASFLAGGEFPVPVSGADETVTIQFREFGISLAFTPTVRGDDIIALRVRPEVSSLDTRNGIRANGFEVPALTVRRADTNVELRDGQAFAIAGLLQNNYANDARKTPWLSNVPVLGALFSSRRYQKSETELVIIVIPRLVQPAAHPDLIATPLDAFAEPGEADLFLMGRQTLPARPDAPFAHTE